MTAAMHRREVMQNAKRPENTLFSGLPPFQTRHYSVRITFSRVIHHAETNQLENLLTSPHFGVRISGFDGSMVTVEGNVAQPSNTASAESVM